MGTAEFHKGSIIRFSMALIFQQFKFEEKRTHTLLQICVMHTLVATEKESCTECNNLTPHSLLLYLFIFWCMIRDVTKSSMPAGS